ncbi:DUF2953 domain-containing protein [Caldinitratiruptor microaerophilus]|uniref:DUF2953 domain-containing protein n=1 Tax=Caldinitratiruptor microaerophilus TaxID=671077 RepID=A0AA35CKA3_9FIRM|nr:DUF2953 domain-containing protein [Caldinitratiruptor microaerophilus]BDG59968.1 hypothetical protein caldi_10580 [Caldinitratiruptor microaerophilus]
MQNAYVLFLAALVAIPGCATLVAPVRIAVTARLDGARGRALLEVRWLALTVRRALRFDLPREPSRLFLRWALAARGGRPVLDRSRLGLARSLTESLLRLARAMAPASGYLRRRVRVERLDIEARIGAGDAMETALAYGTAWAAIGQVLAAAAAAVHLPADRVRVSLIPEFEREGLWGAVHVGTRVRALDLVGTAWALLRAGGLSAARQALLRARAALRGLRGGSAPRGALRIAPRPRRAG